MAKIAFKSYNQNEGSLFPLYLSDLIPANHPARVVNEVVERMDIGEILRGYKGGGASSYHPVALLKVLFWAYLSNVYSGRQMERLWKENVVYMWLGGTKVPDFRTINNFRSGRLKDTFEGLFTQMVELLHSEGLVSLNVQYIDGTKVESVANKYSFVWKRATLTNQGKLDAKVKAVLREAETVLEEENASEYAEPMTAKEIEDKTEAIIRKMEEKKVEDKKLRKAVQKAHDEMAPKMKEYEEKLEVLGERNSYSKTDEDATFMRMKEDAMNNGQTKPGYNVQIATENQFITNVGMYQRPTDWGTMIPFLESFKERYGRQSGEVVADSGYGNEQNYAYMEQEDIIGYVKYNMFHAEYKKKYRKNPFLTANMFYNKEQDFYVCPMGQHLGHVGDSRVVSDLGYVSTISKYKASDCSACPLKSMCYKGKADCRTIEINHRNNEYRARAKNLLTSERGLHHRSCRPIEPEAVFGDIKYNHGFKRFRLKSLSKVKVEFGLVAMAHNLRKYAKLRKCTDVAMA